MWKSLLMHYFQVNCNLKTCIVSYYHFRTGTKHTFWRYIKPNEKVGYLTPFHPNILRKKISGRNVTSQNITLTHSSVMSSMNCKSFVTNSWPNHKISWVSVNCIIIYHIIQQGVIYVLQDSLVRLVIWEATRNIILPSTVMPMYMSLD